MSIVSSVCNASNRSFDCTSSRRSQHVRAYRLAACLYVTLVACGQDAAQGGSPDFLPGRTIELPTARLLNPPRLILKEQHRLGVAADGPSFTFADVTSATLTPSGVLIVADAGNSQVVLFNTQGELLRRIGRAGSGPGEFQFGLPIHVAFGSDTLFVLESMLHLFTADGKVLGTGPVDAGAARGKYTRVLSFAHSPNGLLLARVVDRRRNEPFVAIIIDSIRVQRLQSLDAGFDTTAVYFEGTTRYKFGRQYVGAYFGSQPSVAVGPHGDIFFTRGLSYDIELIANGTRSLIAGGLDAEKVSEHEKRKARDSVIAYAQRLEREQPDEWRGIVEAARNSPVSDSKPRLGQLLAGQDSLLLVERRDMTGFGQPGKRASTWDILHLGRGVVGQVLLPAGVSPLAVGPSTIVAIGRGDDGEPVVIRYGFTTPQ